MQFLQVRSGVGSLAAALKNTRSRLDQLLTPLRDLIRVNIELLGQFRQRFVLAYSRTAASATFALNAGECFRRDRFAIFCSLSNGLIMPRIWQIFHLTPCSKNRDQLLVR